MCLIIHAGCLNILGEDQLFSRDFLGVPIKYCSILFFSKKRWSKFKKRNKEFIREFPHNVFELTIVFTFYLGISTREKETGVTLIHNTLFVGNF